MAQAPATLSAEATQRINALCKQTFGAAPAGFQPLPAGLGPRRFARVQLARAPHSVIARVEARENPAYRPAGIAPEPPLAPLLEFMYQQGLPVPRLYAQSSTAPEILLLEDGGDLTFEKMYQQNPQRAAELLPQIIADAGRLQKLHKGAPAATLARRLDNTLLRYKADLFARYSLPLALQRETTAAERNVVRRAFALIERVCADANYVLAHRDFQSRNLLVQPDGAVMWIDVQGAFMAPPEYDLVCLLHDSYIEWGDHFYIDDYFNKIAQLIPGGISPLSFYALSIARKCKDHARFVQAAREGGQNIPPEHLECTRHSLQLSAVEILRILPDLIKKDYPEFIELSEWFALLPDEIPCAQ